MTTTMTYADLEGLVVRQLGDEKHARAADSTLDVLWVLYDRILRIDPHRPDDPDRDRFVLSKGHGPMSFYAILAAKGFFPLDELDSFGRFDSRLGMHPDRTLVPGVEIGSGSLGHGLGLAVGMTLALRAQGRVDPRVFVLVGDGELDEGSNHEAIAYAGRAGLGQLTAIAIDNASSSHGWPGGIAARFAVEGWETETIDGRDHDAIASALNARAGSPRAIVAEVRR